MKKYYISVANSLFIKHYTITLNKLLTTSGAYIKHQSNLYALCALYLIYIPIDLIYIPISSIYLYPYLYIIYNSVKGVKELFHVKRSNQEYAINNIYKIIMN